MKKLILFFLAWTSLSVSAQQLLETELKSDDFRLQVFDALLLEDGSNLLLGLGLPFSGFDSTQAFLLKVDSSLNLLWAKRFKQYNRDDFSSMTRLSDGNVLITGTQRTNAFAPKGGSLVKVDTAGNVIWNRLYADSFDDRITAAFEASDGSLFLVDRKGVTDNPTKLLVTDASGTLLSSRAYVDGDQDGLIIDAAGTDGAGTYYLAGDQFNPATGTGNLLILAVDSTNLLWSREYNFGRTVFCNQVQVDGSGRLWLLGGIVDTTTFFSTSNGWLMQLGAQGAVQWAREYAQDIPYTDNFSDLELKADGSALLVGRSFDEDGSFGTWLAVDSLGQLQEVRAYAQAISTGLASLSEFPGGRWLLVGNGQNSCFLSVVSEAGESSCSERAVAFVDSALTVTSTPVIFTNDPPTLSESAPALAVSSPVVSDSLLCTRLVANDAPLGGRLSLFPNPSRDWVQLDFPGGRPAQVRVLDLQGREVFFGKIRPGERLTTGHWPAGAYVLQVVTEGGHWWGKMWRE